MIKTLYIDVDDITQIDIRKNNGVLPSVIPQTKIVKTKV